MFVYTMKASGIKFFAVVAVSVALLATAIGILPALSASTDVATVATDFKNVQTEEDMAEFLSQFGYEIDQESVSVYKMDIPEEFNSVYEKYNEIQRAQGLNLKRYVNKSCTAYVFKVTNYEYDGEVFATLFIKNGRVIAGDVCSKDGDGFVHGFRKL